MDMILRQHCNSLGLCENCKMDSFVTLLILYEQGVYSEIFTFTVDDNKIENKQERVDNN